MIREAVVDAVMHRSYRIHGAMQTDTLNASAHLRRLRDLGLLDMKGAGNRVYYVPTAAFTAARASGDPVGPMGSDTPQAAADTHHPPPDTHQSHPNTPQLLAALPEGLRARLPRPGSKPRREVLRALLVDLCRWRAFSARELAALLEREDHKHLVREFLSPMVAEGLLAYTIPEMENHPGQRYTALPPAAADGAS